MFIANHVKDSCEEVIEILEKVPEVRRPQEKMDEDSVGEVEIAKKKQNDESLRLVMKTDKACAEKNGDIKTFSDKAKDSSTEANGSVRTEAPEIEGLCSRFYQENLENRICSVGVKRQRIGRSSF